MNEKNALHPTQYKLTTAHSDLAVYVWPKPAHAKAIVYFLHSWGGYHQRYQELIRNFYKAGYWVCGYDTYGHGQSSGVRGDVPDFETHISELSAVMEFCKDKTAPATNQLPTVLFAFGSGMIASSMVAMHQLQKIDALILNAPYFEIRKTRIQRFIINFLPIRYMGFLRIPTQATGEKLLQDPYMRKAYDSDPLRLRYIYSRSYLYIQDGAKHVMDMAPNWHIPTLLIYNRLDRIVDRTGTENFIKKLPPNIVKIRTIEERAHLFYQDTNKQQHTAAMLSWLDKKFGSSTSENEDETT